MIIQFAGYHLFLLPKERLEGYSRALARLRPGSHAVPPQPHWALQCP